MQHGGHATTKSKQSTTTTLSLRPRNTVQHKPKARRTRWLLSWKGLEQQRDQIRALAREVYESDAALRASTPSSVATGLICAAIRDPSTAPSHDVARAAEAQKALRDLHSRLVWEHNLEFDFVRREWAPILDPSPAEAARCEQMVRNLKRAAGKSKD